MTMKAFRPAATAVAKSVIVGCRSAQVATRLASSTVSIGCGVSRIDVVGWTAARAVAEWSAADNPTLNSITASAYTASGWYEAILLTHSQRGVDFRINFLVDDEVELLVNEVHKITTVGQSGTLSFALSTPLGDILVENIDLGDASAMTTAIEEIISDFVGISAGDITVDVTNITTGFLITLTYAGQFAGQSMDLPDVDDSGVLRPTASPATLTLVQQGSTGADHKIEIGFTITPEYQETQEVQILAASTDPAPSSGTFLLSLDGSTWTDPIPYNATAFQVQSALSDIDVATTCSITPENTIRILFTEPGNVSLLQVDNDGLSVSGPSPSISVTVIQEGRDSGPGQHAIHAISIPGDATGGIFTLTYGGTSTGPLAYDISTTDLAAEIATASGHPVSISGSYNVEYEYDGPVSLPVASGSFTNGVSASADLTSGGAGSSSSRWKTLFFTGTSTVGPDQTAVYSLNIRSFADDGVSVAQPSANAKFTFTWRNPHSDSGYLSVDVNYGATLRQFWDAVYAAERTYALANDGYSATQFCPTLVPAIDLDPTNGEKLLIRTNQANSTSIICQQFAFYTATVDYGAEFPKYFDVSEITEPDGTRVAYFTGNKPSTNQSGRPTTTHRVSGTFTLGVTTPGSTQSTTTLSTGSATPASILTALEALSNVVPGDIEIRAVGFGAYTYSTPSMIEYRVTPQGVTHGINEIVLVPVSLNPDTGSAATMQNFSTKIHATGGVATADTVFSVSYEGTPTYGQLVWDIGGSATINTTWNASNTTIRNALNILTGTTGKITVTGGPVHSSPITITIDKSVPGIDLGVTYQPMLNPSVSSTQTGYAADTAVEELVRVVVSNANGGSFTLTYDGDETASIAYNASAAAVQSALSTAGIPSTSVTYSSGYVIHFPGAATPVTADDSGLTNTVPQPSYSTSTASEGGGQIIIGGLLGGTFDLRLVKSVGGVETEFFVRDLPFNITNSALVAQVEGVIGETVIATDGTLPETPVQLEFTDSIGSTHWDVTVIPHLTIEGSSGGTITKIRSGELNSPDNVWDLEIVPGTDTPGLKDYDASDDWGYLYLHIETPDGDLSVMQEPTTIGTTDIPTYMPSVVKIRWIDLTAEQLEETINEAFGSLVCRVVQPIQSVEQADFTVSLPVQSGVGSVQQRVRCWYTRSVFRIIFCGDFYARSSISNISVQIPSNGTQTVSVRDFMLTDDNAVPQNSVDSLVTDNLGSDKWDAAKESSRIATAFLIAEQGGQPIHKFGIHRASASGLMSYRFKLMDRFILSSSDYQVARYGTAEPIPCQVRFHWAKRTTHPTTMVHSYEIFTSSELLPFDATTTQIASAISTMGFGSNVLVRGSLFGSTAPDTFDPAIGLPADVPSNAGFSGLEISFVGALQYQPFNAYGLYLIMSVLDMERDTPIERFFYRSGNSGLSRTDIDNPPMLHYELVSDSPIPPYENTRISISPENTGPYRLSVAGHLITLNAADTADQVATKLVTAFGSLPYGVSADLTSFSWDNDLKTFESATVHTHKTWMPERFAVPAKVFGSTVASGLEIEFCGMGLQFTDVAVGIGPTEYSEDPITITVLVQGEGDQHAVFLLTIPSDATAGTVTIGTNTHSMPLENASLEETFPGASIASTDFTHTVTFDDSASHSLPSFTSNTLRTGSASSAVSVQGGLDGTLVISELVAGSGPKWFNASANWGSSVPSSGDELIFDDATGDVCYGIDLVGNFVKCGTDRFVFTDRVFRFRNKQKVWIAHEDIAAGYYYIRQPAGDGTFSLSATVDGSLINPNTQASGKAALKCSVTIMARYSGDFGLDEYSGTLPQYLPKYLAMWFTTLVVGSGDGDGQSMARFDTDNFATAVNIQKSEAGGTYPAIRLLLNNAESSVEAVDASVGIAIHLGETSVFDTYTGNQCDLLLGRTIMHGTIVNNNGSTTSLDPEFLLT